MAGSKKVTRQRSRGGRGRGKVQSPVRYAQSPNKTKKARVIEIVDISSICLLCILTHLHISIRESNPIGCGKDEKGSKSVKNQQGVDETWMKSSVEEIRDVVTTFTQFMMSNTPTFNTIQAQAGYPRILPGTPSESSVNMRTEPESIVTIYEK
ncbi:hypothetical protein SESBI_12658 [Sesbania bispinosa]|nr:hypothetical protein SESBI_12658 [Sesbania bispinosa]